MRISVIIPVFNVQQYITECIESVINQTHTDLEVVLVDDGSNDGSGALCEKFATQYHNQIKVLHTENRGPLHARMLGIKEASAEVLVFLDGDDCLRSDALNLISNKFEQEVCDMIMFDTGKWTQFQTISISHLLESGKIYDEQSKIDLYKKVVNGEIPNSVCLKAVRKSCIIFPDNLAKFNVRHGEDLLLTAHLITHCKKFIYLKEGLYYYRNRPGSAIHTFDFQRKESIKTVHTEIEKCIVNWNMPELISMHNARKVKGWVNNFLLLIRNKKQIGKSEFKKELRLMSNDPYFRDAYKNMKRSTISYKYRIIAFLLYYNWLYK